MRACNFIKKKLQNRCFPGKLEKLRALFLQNTSGGCFWNYCSFFTLKYTCVSKRRDVKNWLITLLINQVLFSFKMKKHGSFAEMNMILITIPKAQVPSFLTLIYWNILLLLKHFFYLINGFRLQFVFFFFLDFLIPLTTETTNISCLFQFISALFKFLHGTNLSES